MTGDRKRVTQKAAWTKETLEMGIKAVRNGGTIRAVAISFNIPFGTLQEGISKGKSGNPKVGRNLLFTSGQEESIATHVTLLAEMFHVMNPGQLHHTAFDFAEQNKMKQFQQTKLCCRQGLAL